MKDGTAKAAAMKHTYPSKYLPGTHWATDAAWEILDQFAPGALSDYARAFLAGAIAGRLMRERAQPHVREASETEH